MLTLTGDPTPSPSPHDLFDRISSERSDAFTDFALSSIGVNLIALGLVVAFVWVVVTRGRHQPGPDEHAEDAEVDAG